MTLTQGIFAGDRTDAAEAIAAAWPQIIDRDGEIFPESGEQQGRLELQKAGYTRTPKSKHQHA